VVLSGAAGIVRGAALSGAAAGGVMKIEKKLILSNIINGAFIILIGFFAFQNLNLVLTKLRFVEIADDLNASFLEMRLAEKNYFLYRDGQALVEIGEKIAAAERTLQEEQDNIIPAIGETDLKRLESLLQAYTSTIVAVRGDGQPGADEEERIRGAGRKLKEYADSITRLERKRVNEIIQNAKLILMFSFWAILLSALLIGHFISQKIVRSLRVIETMTRSISEGNFAQVANVRPRDELGTVIDAVNHMSEELSNREEQIIQSKKLASLGILTAGVAHEITNPLNNISMIAQTYDEMYDHLPDQQRLDLIKTVDAETERIRKIVKNLLDFSKPKDANPKDSDINIVVQKTLTLVQNMIDVQNIETIVRLKEGLPHVFIDEHQVQQVLVNLITNAVQAMSSGGRLFVASRTGMNKDTIEITVKDTGKGIQPEFLSHIFDPFFSTKGEGGTGLGLSVSYGIIKNHRGNIRVESKPGVGTTFTVELPTLQEH
jgi:two-component system, NtrC family, sensor kinase